MSSWALASQIKLYWARRYYALLCDREVQYSIVRTYSILYYTIRNYPVLFCSILYYADILYYSKLYYAILHSHQAQGTSLSKRYIEESRNPSETEKDIDIEIRICSRNQMLKHGNHQSPVLGWGTIIRGAILFSIDPYYGNLQ